MQSWPLWYAGLAVVGLLVMLGGWATGRSEWIRRGAYLVGPFFGLVVYLIFVLTISAVVNLAFWIGERWRGSKDQSG